MPKPTRRAPSLPDQLKIDIEALAYGGSGIGREAGRAVFVPFTIPGERVLARVMRERDGVLYAEGITLVAASADRVRPACPHFGRGGCGLCQWQHIEPTVQPLIKQDVLVDQLLRVGKLSEPVLERALRPIQPAPQVWGYNDHMTFSVVLTADGARLGFPSNDDGMLPITDCRVLHPDLLALYETLDLDLSHVKRARLQRGSDGATMIVLYLASDDLPELEADFPTSVNVILPDNEPLNLIGDAHVRYLLGGRWLRATAGAQFRANTGALPPLIETVRRALDVPAGGRILDLYAGVGVFSAALAETTARIVLVESYPPAVTDADANLADFPHMDVIEGAVEEVLPALDEIAPHERFDAALVDPPSRGLSDGALSALWEAGMGRLVYVSDDAPAFARDCAKLTRQGWRLSELYPFDLAPHTTYVTAVARFERGRR